MISEWSTCKGSRHVRKNTEKRNERYLSFAFKTRNGLREVSGFCSRLLLSFIQLCLSYFFTSRVHSPWNKFRVSGRRPIRLHELRLGQRAAGSGPCAGSQFFRSCLQKVLYGPL